MTLTDSLMLTCALSRWTGDQQACRWCDRRLMFNRWVWCSTSCMNEYRENHVWDHARPAARARDKGCVDCPTDTASNPGLLEVDHTTPVQGRRQAGCQHHQDGLRTRCEHHHQLRHELLAATG